MIKNEYDQLNKVVLGSLFDTTEIVQTLDLQGKWRQAFASINDQAIDELHAIEAKLRDLSVEVQRPIQYSIRSPYGLSSPPLAPRDWFFIYKDVCLLGNEAHQTNQPRTQSITYNSAQTMPTFNIWSTDTLDKFNSETLERPYFHTANILRHDNDLFVSRNLGRCGNQLGFQWFENFVTNTWPGTEIHLIDTEEHLDAALFFVKPGLVLSLLTHDQLPKFFKDWQVITVDKTNQREEIYKGMLAYQWKKLNPIIAERYSYFLQCDPEETMFSINALSVNQNCILFPGEDRELFDILESEGIECISVDMRALSFWDSGLHCCTSEIDRCG
jgi:N-dimethylarginine dimethylaminohydrolase